MNAIAPGFIKTDMTDALPEQQKEALASQIPLARLGTVDDIAQSVLFLASKTMEALTLQLKLYMLMVECTRHRAND